MQSIENVATNYYKDCSASRGKISNLQSHDDCDREHVEEN